MRYRTITLLRQFIKLFAIVSVLSLTKTSHFNTNLPQEVYIWQKKWGASLQPAITKTTPYLSGWRFLAGEYEPDGKIIYPNIQFNILTQSLLPLTAVYRFDRLRPLPSVDEIFSLIENSPAYHTYHIQNIELDLDWPTLKLQHYIQLIKTLKTKFPASINLNITMIPDWMHSPFFTELTKTIPCPVLQVHSVDTPQTGLFSTDNAFTYIKKMSQLTYHDFYVALPTYGLKIQQTPYGTIYAIEAENNYNTGNTGAELYSDPQQIRKLIQKLQKNTPAHLHGIVWFRLPIAEDKRNWSQNTWLTMIKHLPFKKNLIIQEIPDPKLSGTVQLVLINQGNILQPLPQTIPLRCPLADGFFPYQLTFDTYGNYKLSLIKQTAPLNTNQQLVIGWMRCSQQ